MQGQSWCRGTVARELGRLWQLGGAPGLVIHLWQRVSKGRRRSGCPAAGSAAILGSVDVKGMNRGRGFKLNWVDHLAKSMKAMRC